MPDGQRAEIARAEYDLSNYFKEQGIMGISNMKLGARLALGFGVVLAMLAVGTFVGVNRLGAMHNSLNNIVNNDNKRIFLANEMVDQVRNIAISVRNIIIIDDTAFEGTERTKLEKASGIFGEGRAKLAGMLEEEESKKMLAAIEETRARPETPQRQGPCPATRSRRTPRRIKVLIAEAEPLQRKAAPAGRRHDRSRGEIDAGSGG